MSVPTEILFVVEDEPSGGFSARAFEASIYTEAETWPELVEHARDAVRCHFDEDRLPRRIRLHYLGGELLTLLFA